MFEPTAIYAPNPHRYDTMTYNRAGELRPQVAGRITSASGTTSATSRHSTQMKSAWSSPPSTTASPTSIWPTTMAPNPDQAEKNCGLTARTSTSRHHRDELVISTKAGYEMWAGPYGDLGSRKYLLGSTRPKSLERLGSGLCGHLLPPPHRTRPHPLEETMGALAHGREHRQGPVRGPVQLRWSHDSRRPPPIFADLHVPFIINQNTLQHPRPHRWNATASRRPRTKSGQRPHHLLPARPGPADQPLSRTAFRRTAASRTIRRFLQRLSASDAEKRLQQVTRPERSGRRARPDAGRDVALAWLLHDGKVTSVLTGASKPQQHSRQHRRAEEHPLQQRGAQAHRRDLGHARNVPAPLL